MPSWLEPRGLNVVELVGKVPEEYLRDTIISYDDWHGIVVYKSGRRTGDQVEITTTIYPRFNEVWWAANEQLMSFGCLGQAPHYDHMGSVVPPSTLRVYDNTGREITSDTVLLTITDVDLGQPIADSDGVFRYPRVEYGGTGLPLPLDANGLHLPANGGCWIRIEGGNHAELTGVFTLDLNPSVYVSLVGTQAESFRSYIGEGWVGLFQPLMDQLRNTYGDRHDYIPLQIPEGANYFLLKFPPMPADPYTDTSSSPRPLNLDRPTGGTYRLYDGNLELSSNMVFSAGFPLTRAWRDADDAPGSTFLPVMQNPPQLAVPEYVIPAFMAYNNCFTTGGCPNDVLQQIRDAQMPLEIIYLRVDPPATGEWVPVKLAGPAWFPSTGDVPGDGVQGTLVGTTATVTETQRFFLPLLVVTHEEVPPPPPPPPPGCPCGWFDPMGRMLGFVP
ncbi:MAG TPA: hypothetical protein VLC95_09915 [Anaerolineae bacterium]|nr:hypothetical protein [Anaerolineae bacterium]